MFVHKWAIMFFLLQKDIRFLKKLILKIIDVTLPLKYSILFKMSSYATYDQTCFFSDIELLTCMYV